MHFSDMELTCRADGRAVVVSPRMVFVMAMEATQMQFFSNSRKLLARIDEPMITFLATSCQPNNFSPNFLYEREATTCGRAKSTQLRKLRSKWISEIV